MLSLFQVVLESHARQIFTLAARHCEILRCVTNEASSSGNRITDVTHMLEMPDREDLLDAL